MTWYHRAAERKARFRFFKDYILPVLKWWVMTWAVSGAFSAALFSVILPIYLLSMLLFG